MIDWLKSWVCWYRGYHLWGKPWRQQGDYKFEYFVCTFCYKAKHEPIE